MLSENCSAKSKKFLLLIFEYIEFILCSASILSSDIKISERLYSISPDFLINKSKVSVICFSEILIFFIIILKISFSQSN